MGPRQLRLVMREDCFSDRAVRGQDADEGLTNNSHRGEVEGFDDGWWLSAKEQPGENGGRYLQHLPQKGPRWS